MSRHFKVGTQFYDAQFHKEYTFLKVEVPQCLLHIDQVPSILSDTTHRLLWAVHPHPGGRPPVQVEDDDQAGDVKGGLNELAFLVVWIVGVHIVVHEEADFAFLQSLRKLPLHHVGDRKDGNVLGVQWALRILPNTFQQSNKAYHLYNEGGENEPEEMVKEFEVGAALSHQTPVGVQDEEHAEDEAPEEVDAEDVGYDVA